MWVVSEIFKIVAMALSPLARMIRLLTAPTIIPLMKRQTVRNPKKHACGRRAETYRHKTVRIN